MCPSRRCLAVTVALGLVVSSPATAQTPVWDAPIITDLLVSRPNPVDVEHDLPALRRMLVAEGRDEAWAARTEATLLAQLNTALPVASPDDRRAVRCGRTICEISVVAQVDAAGAALRSEAFDAGVRRTAYALGIDHRTTASVFDEAAPSNQAILTYLVRK